MEVPYRDRAPAPRWLLGLAAVTGTLAVLAMLTIDRSLARWLAGYRALAFWDWILDVLEWGLGLPLIPWTSAIVLVIVMGVVAAVPKWRHLAPAWMFVAAVHITSRIAMVQIKDVTGRLRPLEWLRLGGDTFGRHDGISFPSGHVVLFASIVLPVIVLYPRARPLLAIVVFAMLARLAADAHYLSDTLAAVALVALVTWICGWAIRPLRGGSSTARQEPHTGARTVLAT